MTLQFLTSSRVGDIKSDSGIKMVLSNISNLVKESDVVGSVDGLVGAIADKLTSRS